MGIQNVSGVAPLFQVFDMPKSIAFYRDVLGFEVVATSKPDKNDPDCDWAMLKLGGATIMLNTRYERDKRPAQPGSNSGHEDVTLYFGCPNVDEAYAEIRQKWANAKRPETAHYGMRQMYLTDPDGFSLCFQHPAK